MAERKPLNYYQGLNYPMRVDADPEGGFVISFPDLPGCITQADTADEIGPMAEEARALWIETEYEAGAEIPLPTFPTEYSGKFNLRLPKSLHAKLAESAERDGVSLNQYVVMLIAAGQSAAETGRSPLPNDLILQRLRALWAKPADAKERLSQVDLFLSRPAFTDVQIEEAVALRGKFGRILEGTTIEATDAPGRGHSERRKK